MFPDRSHYKKYNGSCFMYLSEILNKLHMFKVTHLRKLQFDEISKTNIFRHFSERFGLANRSLGLFFF